MIQVSANGQLMQVQVPEGVGTGGTFGVLAPQQTPVIAQAIPPGGSDAQLARELQLADLAIDMRALGALGAAGSATTLTHEEEMLINYKFSVKCFACIDGLFTMLNTLAGKFGVIGLVLLVGPICGYLGAQRLELRKVGVYMAFCVLHCLYELVLFLVDPWWLLLCFFLIQVYVSSIVYKFVRMLQRVGAERATQLADPTLQSRARFVYY